MARRKGESCNAHRELGVARTESKCISVFVHAMNLSECCPESNTLLNFFECEESGSGIPFATGTWHADCYLITLFDDGRGPAAGLTGLDLFLMGLGVIVNSGKSRMLFDNVSDTIDIRSSDIVIHMDTLAES